MILKEVRIKNFRSLKDINIIFDKTTILVGENNVGKSNVLDIIEKGLSDLKGRNKFTEYDIFMTSDVEPSIVNTQIEDAIEIIYFIEYNTEEDSDDIMDRFLPVTNINGSKGEIRFQVKVHYREDRDIVVERNFINSKNEVINAVGLKDIKNNFLNMIMVFKLQALRDINRTMSKSSNLWGAFIRKVSISSSDLASIQQSIKSLNDKIISSDKNLNELLKEIENIQKIINYENKDDELVSIDAIPLKSWDLLSKAQVAFKNSSLGVSLPIDIYGQGTHSTVAILLFKAYINIILKSQSSSGKLIIMTLEEPEVHLHPQAIRALYRAINEIDGVQKIITTHSQYILEYIDITSIRFLKKISGETVIKSLINKMSFDVKKELNDDLKVILERKKEDIRYVDNKIEIFNPDFDDRKILEKCIVEGEIENSVDEILNISNKIIDRKTCQNLRKYIQLYSKGDIFFARKWVLYEGATEGIIIPYLARLMGKDFSENGVSGIMYRGFISARDILKIAKELDIPWIMLSDNDSQGQCTKTEISNAGYVYNDVQDRVFYTDAKDIEYELGSSKSILEDFKRIVANCKCSNKASILKAIKREKISVAYKLIEIWDERGLSIDEIPSKIKQFIEKV